MPCPCVILTDLTPENLSDCVYLPIYLTIAVSNISDIILIHLFITGRRADTAFLTALA